jgi:hypothetical protein
VPTSPRAHSPRAHSPLAEGRPNICRLGAELAVIYSGNIASLTFGEA